jgi:serine/threonine protein phosphatase PrpC
VNIYINYGMQNIQAEMQNGTITESAMVKAFVTTDDEYKQKNDKAGCTAAVALIVKSGSSRTLITANCGDARITLK